MSEDDMGMEMAEHSYEASTISQLQAIDANYYNIVDAEDWPIAGLIVLLDRRKQPVRAELHLYEELSERHSEFALRQAQQVLSERYYSNEPVQLQVNQSYPWRESLEVHTNALVAPTANDPLAFFQDYWQYIIGAGALLLLILFIWGVSAFFRSPANDPAAAEVATTAQVDAPVVAEAATATPTPIILETNNLPASRNANPSLAIGQRVRVLPGITVSLVSEPSPDQEKVIGFLQEGQEVIIVNGPVLRQGASDTIVWWFVRLDSGQDAWVPANTSDTTLLGPVQ
ncbi:MAG: hypothetical protein R3C14_48430 [Caldilineaceae bacterium]